MAKRKNSVSREHAVTAVIAGVVSLVVSSAANGTLQASLSNVYSPVQFRAVPVKKTLRVPAVKKLRTTIEKHSISDEPAFRPKDELKRRGITFISSETKQANSMLVTHQM